EIFRLTISSSRFRFLLRCIRIDDKTTRAECAKLEKLALIRDFFSKFVENCKTGYSLSEYVTVDEKLEAFKGRCSFRQYIPSKPNKYGIKIFVLVDAKIMYTSNISSMFGFKKNSTIVSYIPKKNKNVILVSSLHHDDNIDQARGKPEIITTYNQMKCRVDVVDQLCSNYNCARSTRRWPMVVFYNILNVAGINSMVIHTCNNPNSNMKRRVFLQSCI
ncbi:DDE Tnp 1 7 domain containing protein, partial [Asbolus verrucosus]